MRWPLCAAALHSLTAAHDDIQSGRWWLMPGAADIDDGEFYAEMKAPKRERDLSTGQLRYRWSETGALEHFRHAHAFDHLASPVAIPEVTILG